METEPKNHAVRGLVADPAADSVTGAVAGLTQKIRGVHAANRVAAADVRGCSTGCEALDRWLPEGGWQPGQLVEWLGDEGGGMGILSLVTLRELLKSGGMLLVLDRYHHFYPPAAAAMGLDLERTTWVRPRSVQDAIWALDQSLRCSAVTAVWARWGELDWRIFRRLQLAAEEGGTLGMLLRPRQHQDEPSWAHLRLQVQAAGFSPDARASPPTASAPRRGQRMIRSWSIQRADQGGMADQGVSVQLDEVTGRLTEVTHHAPSVMPVAPQLAATTPR